MPNLKDLKGRIKLVKSTQKIAMLIVGVLLMANAANATPPNPFASPQQLADSYKAAYNAKNCDALLTLFDFTGTPAKIKEFAHSTICDFEYPIKSIELVAPAANEMSPSDGPDGMKLVPNLPIVNVMVVQQTIPNGGGGMRFKIGKIDQSYAFAWVKGAP